MFSLVYLKTIFFNLFETFLNDLFIDAFIVKFGLEMFKHDPRQFKCVSLDI